MPRTPQAVQRVGDWTATYEAAASAKQPAWLSHLRQAAYQRFHELGYPTPHAEAWRHTNAEPIATTNFLPASDPSPRPGDGAIEPFRLSDLRGPLLVFVNGRPVPALSAAPKVAGLRLEPLFKALTTASDALEPHLGQYADFQQQPFTALNTALWHDGAYVDVAPGTVLANPVHLLYLSTAESQPTASFPRTLVRVGDQSQVRLIETYAGTDGGVHLTCAVTEVVAGEASNIEHYTIQRQAESNFHVHDLQVEQDRASTYTHHNVALGAALARTDLAVRFAGEGADCTLNGLYVLHGTQHVDTHTFIDHARPRCTSRELYKGILDENSHGVFYGKILVRPDAAKTNSGQTNKNLLLSDGALVDSIPALEINHNDVKCSHGSAIGQLDRDQVFYLQTRGLDASVARSLLTYAFAGDVVGRMTLPPVRARLEELLLARLPNGPAVKETLHALEA